MARIRTILRATGGALLLLGLSACSHSVRVRAAFISGRFGFVLADGERPQGSHCLARLLLSNQAGETVWELERPEIRLDGCDPWLPLPYGSTPPGVRTLVAAPRLQMEIVYVLYAEAFDSVEGAFVLHRAGNRLSVENLDLRSDRVANAQEAARNWQGEQSDRAHDNAQRPQNEIFEGPFQDRPLPPEQH